MEDMASVDTYLSLVHEKELERFGSSSDGTLGSNILEGYCRAVFNLLYKPTVGAFDKLFNILPSEPWGNAQEADAIAASIPIFRSGHKNSNVLSMKMDVKPYYLAGLQYNLLAERGKQQSRGTGTVMDPTLLTDQQRQDIVNKGGISQEQLDLILAAGGGDFGTNQALLQKLSGISKEITGFSILNENDYQDFLYFILSLQEGSGSEGVEVVIPQVGGANAFVSVKGGVDTIINQVLAGAVKTLPYFKMSGLQVMARPVVMMIREANTVGVKNTASPLTEQLYSGFWNIFGFKHVINNREAYSEFSMKKQPGKIGGFAGVTELTEQQEAAALQATIENWGSIYTAEEILTAQHTQEAGETLVDSLMATSNQEQSALADWIMNLGQNPPLATGSGGSYLINEFKEK
jgi:hypothetical protein